MDLLTSQQSRMLDARVIERTPISGYELMCRAAQASLNVLDSHWPRAKSVVVLCGTGNNGGDGYVLARLLLERSDQLRVYGSADEGRGDGARAKRDYVAAGGEVLPLTQFSAPPSADLIVDALFGTGLSRPLNDEVCAWIELINRSSAPVLSLDLPSGLNGDTGAMYPQAVRAAVTVSFIARKRGMYTGNGRDCCGEIVVDGLGVDGDLPDPHEPVAQLLQYEQLSHGLPRRRHNVHKGDFGHVLVVGGAPGMAGAARLAAEAALRAGAGQVSVATVSDNVAPIVAGCPALMVHDAMVAGTPDVLLERATVIVVGPGLGCDHWGRVMLGKVLEAPQPKVVDADALRLLALDPAYSDEWILTPHPGEAAGLLQCATATVGTDRFDAAAQIASRYGGVCVLKGSGTLISSSRGVAVCAGGNAGMATAGMGDVLSGVIAALLAQGLALDAAATGVCIHAEAGDRAAQAGVRGLIASDLMPHIRACANPPPQ